MEYESIIYRKEDEIATIWFNRPEVRNAWNAQMGRELDSALREIDADPDVMVVILTGSGDKAFSAGADLKDPRTHSVESLADSIDAAFKGVRQLPFGDPSEFPKPIIAAINGYASGIGFIVALACDILIASEDAKMNLPQVSLGIVPGLSAPLRLAQFVGKGKAMEMCLTADWIDAKEAYRIGLVRQGSSALRIDGHSPRNRYHDSFFCPACRQAYQAVP